MVNDLDLEVIAPDGTPLRLRVGAAVGVGGGPVVLAGLGHQVPAAAGLRCRCGETGCLETVASGWALVERLRTEGEDGRIGWGEGAPLPWFGTEQLAEALEIVTKLGDEVGPEALGQIPACFGCVGFGLAAAIEPPGGPAASTQRLPVAALRQAAENLVLVAIPTFIFMGVMMERNR